jgi:hypothetical protein
MPSSNALSAVFGLLINVVLEPVFEPKDAVSLDDFAVDLDSG